MNLAIITARGGSKRIPRKNIKPFCGKPIIRYSIDAAKQSGIFDTVMVSTDDEMIASISRAAGAEVPFFRSIETSNDYATTSDVLFEVLEQYSIRDTAFDYLCCIYPTAPFINSELINTGMRLLINSGADSVIPVVRFSFPPQRGFVIKSDNLQMLYPEHLTTRSQDLQPMYHDAGLFYCVNIISFMIQRKLLMLHSLPLILPEEEVQDIDNEEDWKIAELKYRILLDRNHEAI